MIKPKIALIARPAMIDEVYPSLYVTEYYRRAIIEFGGNPFLLLPPQNINYQETKCSETPEITPFEQSMIEDYLKICDGIVLPGGNKIFYYEYFIVKYAIEHNIPILGTCLGMQIMATCDAPQPLVRNETAIEHNQPGVPAVHQVHLEKNSQLAKILGKQAFMVNSRHSYHIEDPGIYKISGYSEDGLIEAIEYPNNDFNIGVQWHPERTYDVDNQARQLWISFMKAATNYQKNKSN